MAAPAIPIIDVLGFVAELSLLLWLVVMGVNLPRWNEQAAAPWRRHEMEGMVLHPQSFGQFQTPQQPPKGRVPGTARLWKRADWLKADVLKRRPTAPHVNHAPEVVGRSRAATAHRAVRVRVHTSLTR